MKRLVAALLGFVLLPCFAYASGQAIGEPSILNLLPANRCDVKPEKGPCKGMFEKYYYDAVEKKCVPFFWGGCGGAVPFEALEDCRNQCLPPQTLRIKKIDAVSEVYAEVSLEFPKAWPDVDFEIQVNGGDAAVKPRAGGFTEDRRSASFLFFPGKPGKKQVSVRAIISGKPVEATGSFDWNGRPFVALLTYAGDRTLVTAADKIGIVTTNIDNVVVKMNGEPIKGKTIGQEATFLSVDPQWRAGVNTVSVTGRGSDGSIVSKTFTLVYLPGGIRQGESVLLRYGTQGTKSGPFYSLVLQGDAVTAGADRTVDCFTLSDDGWIGGETLLVRELKAVKPGRANVRIFEKPHFLEQKKLKEEIVITVLPTGR